MEFTGIPLGLLTQSIEPTETIALFPHDIDKWIKDQNAYEDKENERRKTQNLPLLGHSTSCCMQASLHSTHRVTPSRKPALATGKTRRSTAAKLRFSRLM